MLTELLTLFFFLTILTITGYLVRHYLFTLTVLRNTKKINPTNPSPDYIFEPTVSILIPAHNEERVIGSLLQKMTEINYPKNKLEVIAIVDASTDKTGAIADSFAKNNRLIKVLHRGPEIGGRGKPAALNDALKGVTGEIIIIFDADYIPILI